MRLRQVFAARPFALIKIRNGVEPQTVDAHVQPEIEHLLHGLVHRRVIEIQIRLVRIEAMPVIRLRHRIPRPVRSLEIFEDDPRFLVFLRRIAPDIEIALRRSRRSAPRFLEPRILIGGVIDHQLGDDAQPALVRRREKRLEILQRAVVRIDVVIIGDVVAIIAQRRRDKRAATRSRSRQAPGDNRASRSARENRRSRRRCCRGRS